MRRIYFLRGKFELEESLDDNGEAGPAESSFRPAESESESELRTDGVGEVTQRPALSATVQFGDPTAAAPFPTSVEGSSEAEAVTAVTPHTVFITRGGSVTFQIAPFLQVAIYEPGTNLAGIEVGPATLETVTFGPFELTNFRINDPRRRVALSPEQTQTTVTWTTPAGTFDPPGRYLAVCTSTPHFVFHHMYGWVIVP